MTWPRCGLEADRPPSGSLAAHAQGARVRQLTDVLHATKAGRNLLK